MAVYGNTYGASKYGTSVPTGSTWRVAEVLGVAGGTRTWRVSDIGGSVDRRTWRIANIGGVAAYAPPSTWRVANISGAIAQWRVANISGSVPAAVAVTLPSTLTVDPIMPTTVVADAGGAAVDSWTWHLGSAPGGTDLDSLLVAPGTTVTFNPPGSLQNRVVYLRATATVGGVTSSPSTSAITITPTPYRYKASDGTLKPMSLIYYATGPTGFILGQTGLA